MLRHPLVTAVAIICLAFLEWQAIVHKVDGAYMAAVVAAIAGIAGYSVQPKPRT